MVLDIILKSILDVLWLVVRGFINIFKGLKKCMDIRFLVVLVILIIASIFVKNGYVLPVIYLIILGTIKPKQLTKIELEQKLNEVDEIIFEIEDLKDNIYLDKREIKRLKKNKTLKELKNYTKEYIKSRAKERRKLKNLKFVVENKNIKFGGIDHD